MVVLCAKMKGLGNKEIIDGYVVRETSPKELKSKVKEGMIWKSSTALWITLALNVEDYSGSIVRMIVAVS